MSLRKFDAIRHRQGSTEVDFYGFQSLPSSDFFFSSRRRHTSCYRDWSSDVCSSDLRIVSWDPDADRLRRLGERARRAGAAVEIGQDVEADAVLADVPCSELGTLR